MKKYFPHAAKTALVLVYLVIVAGALVRMTGSGMGCPDWPKCFGYYIPPTDIKELTWAPQRSFEEGQVLIRDEALLVANADFTTTSEFDARNWRPYTKHDYAIFNPVHTWIEYLNRLAGALAGLAVLAMAFLAIPFRRAKPAIVWLSWLTVFLMGFQAWLGATVVYSVLNPIKITLHLVVALVIVAVILFVIRMAKPQKDSRQKQDRLFRQAVAVSLACTLVQVVLGTQVRQYVDEQVKMLGYGNMDLVLQNPVWNFYIHRTFSVVVLLLNVYLFVRNRQLQLGYGKTGWVLGLVGAEILSGIILYYADFPFGLQTAHLVLASVLFGVQFYLLMESKSDENPR